MPFETLHQWLAWQETLHPNAIELGLERCREVAARMPWSAAPFRILSVAGTNGKGSAVAMLESILLAAGYRTGAYTSPHLIRYNERIRINGRAVDDGALCAAFERVDAARGETTLTYFEFGTLAAMDIFQRSGLDVVVLEVGLGGRLDAVNLFDADAALVTTVAIDHVQWLGSDREAIGREKAGIFRQGRPAVCADPDPPASVEAVARALGAVYFQAGRDYAWGEAAGTWSWRHGARALAGLPRPGLPGRFQVINAAAALMLLDAVRGRLPVSREAVAGGLAAATLPGRLQVFAGPVEWVVDVAHNPQAARELAAFLAGRPCRGRTFALVGMLADKDLEGVIGIMGPVVDAWAAAGLDAARAAPGRRLAEIIAAQGGAAAVRVWADVGRAWQALSAEAEEGDRVVVFGSFHTAGAVLARLATAT